MLHNIMFEFS